MILDDDYISSTSVSQSKLKRLLVHPQYYLNYSVESEFDEPKQTISIGDAVDLILTQGKKAFNQNYYVTSIDKPTGQMGDFVWYLFAHRADSNAEQIAYEKAGFKRDTLQKVRERFQSEGQLYYNALIEGENKRVITDYQYDKIKAIVESLQTNDFTREYFVNDKESGRYSIFKQVAIDFVYEGVDCKALLDMIVVDRFTDELTPIDIKTSSCSTSSWETMFYKFRYDIQAAFYTKAINSIDFQERFGAKTINNFKFIVENQDFPGNPLIFEVSPETLEAGEIGGESRGRKFEGFKQAIERYKWHTENNLWSYRMEDYINKGVRTI
jgi:hypothetical protein